MAALILPPSTVADDVSIQHASVTPKRGFTDSVDGVRIEFRLAASAPADVTIRIVGSGDEVRRMELPAIGPGSDRVETWDGLTGGGRPVADGTYRVLIQAVGGAEKEVGSVALHGHLFPVRGPPGTRGPVGEFGAQRNGARVHKGFDVTGACGTPLAAARTGTVIRRHYDPRLDGNFVVIRGLGERRAYLYAHMVHPSPFHRGDEVHVGQIVGRIGRTGNAGSTPCHLHFEIHLRGRPIDPKPYLRAWDRYS